MKREAPTTKAKQRELLADIIRQLRSILREMHNRPPKPRRRTGAPRTTIELRIKIRRLYRRGYSMQRIAQMLNTSIGRVSETISGKRT